MLRLLGNHRNHFPVVSVCSSTRGCCRSDDHGQFCSDTQSVLSVSSQHSLVVVRTKHLRWLGLRSLKEVSAGKVMLKDNLQLCYTQPFQWRRLFRSDQQNATISNNRPAELCGEYVLVSEPRHGSSTSACMSRIQLAKVSSGSPVQEEVSNGDTSLHIGFSSSQRDLLCTLLGTH